MRWLESLALAREASQWLQQSAPDEGADATAPLEAPLIVSVGDREADIYELLVEAQQHRNQRLGLLVRAQYNRTLAGEEAQLWQHIASSPRAGSFTLQLSLERLKPMMALDMMVASRIMGMSAAASAGTGVGLAR